MQIFKCLLTVCVAVCTLSVYSQDNDAQTKAREALEKKLNELQGQTAQPAPVAPRPAPAAPKAAPKAAPAAPQPPPQPVAPAPADSDSIAKARQALEQKLNELQAQPTRPAQPTPPPAPAPQAAPPPAAATPVATQPAPQSAAPAAADAEAIAKARQALEQKMKETQGQPAQAAPAAAGYAPVAPADSEAIAKAREALREKMQALGTPPAATAPAATSAAPTALPPGAPAVAVTPVEPPTTPGINSLPEADAASINKARASVRSAMSMIPPEATGPDKNGLNFPPLQGPPLGISAEKEQKLRNLLQQYKMDLVTPEQYQAARAKILAEP